MESIKTCTQIAQVGDAVTIIKANDCRFGYNRLMKGYIGQEAIVKSVSWMSGAKGYAYFLDVDNMQYAWCDKCIARIDDTEIEESDVSVDILFEGCVK